MPGRVPEPDDLSCARKREQEKKKGGASNRSSLQIAIAALARREYGCVEMERLLRRKMAAGGKSAVSAVSAISAVSSCGAHDDASDDAFSCKSTTPIPDEIAQTLDRLRELGLLSDARMAQAWTRSRGARYGRQRLRQELARKGVGDETIRAALPSADEERRAAWALWQKKFGRPPETMQERARQGRFLAARGFDAEIVFRILKGSPDDAL